MSILKPEITGKHTTNVQKRQSTENQKNSKYRNVS